MVSQVAHHENREAYRTFKIGQKHCRKLAQVEAQRKTVPSSSGLLLQVHRDLPNA